MSPHLFTIVMAGGSGTRFWPLSRAARPKQLLALTGLEETLLQATVRRMHHIAPHDRTLVVTSEALANDVAKQLPYVPKANILAEPVGRNTAPCVAWAAAHVYRRDKNGILAIVPADHVIANEGEFQKVARTAIACAESRKLVTIGIKPERPETGYGYIQKGTELSTGGFNVEKFIEKPTKQRAEELLKAGGFLWNSGMFFMRADEALNAFRTLTPELYASITKLDEAANKGNEEVLVKDIYPKLASESFDVAIMEKANNIAVVEGDFGWSDLGSWTTAWELAKKDTHDNSGHDNTIFVDAHGCHVHSDSQKVIAMVGVHDLVVIETDDAILVVPRDRSQDVKLIIEELKTRKQQRLL